MSREPHIRAVSPEATQDQPLDTSEFPEIEASDDENFVFEDSETEPDYEPEVYYDDIRGNQRREWIVPALAVLAIVGWTGFYVWALRDDILSGVSTPQLWTSWIVDWSVPVLLIGIAWLVAMRNSSREARRFADTAALLSAESVELETRLGVVNRELSLAREFLGSQSLELQSLGRMASERLSEHAEELQSLIKSNGKQVEQIGKTSDSALKNMTKLRDDLPVVATSAKDVTNQVGNAGRTAQEQLDKLISGFERLNDFGKASERQVHGLSAKVDDALTGFENQMALIEDMTKARFEALNEKTEAYRAELENRETNALTSMRGRADDLREGLNELDTELAEQKEKTLAALKTRIAVLRGEGETLASGLRSAEANALEALRHSKDRLRDEISEVVETLQRLDNDAIEASRARIQSLNAEAGRFDDRLAERDLKFVEEMSRRQDEFDTREAQATEVLSQRLAELDEALAERREAQIAETEKLIGYGKDVGDKLDELNTLFGSISEQGEQARSSLGSGLTALDEQLANNRSELAQTEKDLTGITDSAVRLLEIIQSGARQSREDLGQAIDASGERLATVEERAVLLTQSMGEAASRGDALSDKISETRANIEQTDGSIDALQSKLAEHAEEALAKLQGLRGSLAKLNDETHGLSEDAQDKLRGAIATLEQATQSAFASIEHGTRDRVAQMAETIGEEAIGKLGDTIRSESEKAIKDLERSAAETSNAGREAAIQLRDQLAMVNELTGNLEQRVARARELAEEQVDNDFSRRMATITDGLNSNAIDITAALSTDISDTSWDAYLKGDRGIFTRRAVRLIDNSKAREIADLYQRDEAFQANVGRYIHDFEAMLRSMLSTRDGNALSVTILGSDMGKLYVLLAQAIERFRD